MLGFVDRHKVTDEAFTTRFIGLQQGRLSSLSAMRNVAVVWNCRPSDEIQLVSDSPAGCLSVLWIPKMMTSHWLSGLGTVIDACGVNEKLSCDEVDGVRMRLPCESGVWLIFSC